MAEYAAVRFLVLTIGSLLVKEVFMVAGLRGDLEYIQSKLESIQSLLKDTDRRKQRSNSQKKTWLNKVRNVAYDIEDLIRKFIYYTDQHEDRDGFIGFLQNAISLPRSIFVMHRIATQLQEIKAKVLDISEIEEELVGIEDNRKELISWLKDEDPRRKVLSVVGMGGLGKTTLVTKVCNNPVVKPHFQCYAWISISQSYKTEELLRRMMKELYNSRKENHQDNIGQIDYMRLVRMLINYLQDKGYVIVLDDVWNKQAWDDISIAIPNNQCGSRVMLTSRIRDLGVEGGFVEERRGLTMNDVAENYLKELIHRSMILVAEVYDFARARSCRLHDLMRDLALSLAEEENFCMVYDGKEAREDR
ncbi:Disease resistance protein [Cinnamomum micranthum f. kanehirae]|uniref:Disease resistance protein n=1 Tax=Cinnamomum micranthum f. kanehirae TaxID=337451 RepID=A0A3S3NCF3_9MAGN|nr:Disease resistance protein [Cinnamomum micranthum f. kanehirae]